MMFKAISFLVVALVALPFVQGYAQEKKTPIGPDLKAWEAVTTKAIQYRAQPPGCQRRLEHGQVARRHRRRADRRSCGPAW